MVNRLNEAAGAPLTFPSLSPDAAALLCEMIACAVIAAKAGRACEQGATTTEAAAKSAMAVMAACATAHATMNARGAKVHAELGEWSAKVLHQVQATDASFGVFRGRRPPLPPEARN